MVKGKKQIGLEQQIGELTQDLQRVRADFENYRKRAEIDREIARKAGKTGAILRLLPVIDNIERAITYIPEGLEKDSWVKGVAGLVKNLEKSLEGLELKRIDAVPGTAFDPNLHDAVQVDEDAKGEHEVIAEELQPGYMLGDAPIRHAMVKVTKQ